MIAVNVVKKRNKVEAFQPQKIINSCVAAGVSEEMAKKVADEVSRKAYPNIPTEIIRRYVYNALRQIDKRAASAYKSYEQAKGRPEEKKPHRHRSKPGKVRQFELSGKKMQEPSGRKRRGRRR